MAATADQTSSRITLFGIALIWLVAQISVAVAHDSWLNRGGYRNPAGEWCCGENDCTSPDQIAVTGKGWVGGGTEFIPFEEATPSRRKDMDLLKARPHAPLRVRSAARFVIPDRQ